ncbi:MAG TPA: cation-transporting P-type ATPase [Candidatus Bipolaricaulota bacterium]|nr:cation-transporting P-type ATPase [Candidatus Bipolaricaulota bacterium]
MAKEKTWYDLSVQEIFEQIKTKKSGLEVGEAKARLKSKGFNKLSEERPLPELKLFFSQFKSVLILILLAAAGISALFSEWVDFGVILAAVFVNVLVGYIQESKAQRSLFELKKFLKLKAVVYRAGNRMEIESEEIVPGDILYLEAGNKVPADARLIEVNQLQTQEAILTGEAAPVIKTTQALVKKNLITGDQKNMVFMGTLIAQGTGLAVVVNTGMKTKVGQIADILQKTEEEMTPFQIQLRSFGRKIGLALISLVLIIFVFGLLSGRDFVEIFAVSVASAVSAIPEGLPVAMTVVLATGMQRILKKKALVRKLVSAETLGSTSVLCVDKTGTLTTGIMKVTTISTFSRDLKLDGHRLNEVEKFLFQAGVLCNNSAVIDPKKRMSQWKIIGSPTEKAIFFAAASSKLNVQLWQKKYARISEVPFSSKTKIMFTLNKLSSGSNRVFCKGAPEVVLKKCSHYQNARAERLTEDIRRQLTDKFVVFGKSGYRVLAAAYKDQEIGKNGISQNGNFVFLGYFIISDALRKDVKKTVKTIERAGIKIVMITGDHVLTATAIAKEIGLSVTEKSVMNGERLAKLSAANLKKEISSINVFARVSPVDKYKIVQAYQAVGEVVAMTGDGVNDAPALKAADIGIAVGAGSEITKQTADLILLNNNLATIVHAIKEGRVIFANIKKVVVYLLTDSFTEVVLLFGSLLFGLPLPLTAAQILWVNLVSDSFPAASLTQEKEEKGVMLEPPQKKTAKILDKEMTVIIFIIGILTDLVLFGLFLYLYNIAKIEIGHLRTFMFAALGLDTMFYIFSCRSLTQSILKIKLWSNKWLLVAVAFGTLMLAAPIYVPVTQNIFSFIPLNGFDWLMLVALSAIKVVGIEIAKYIFIRRNK